MRVTLVPSATSPRLRRRQYLSSYLLNDTLAIDAGALGLAFTTAELARIKHVFVTHTHLDHIASLPMFLDQAYTATGDCVTLHATAEVLHSLHRHVFNDQLWPDLIRISRTAPPYLKLHTIQPGRTVKVDGLALTPVPVNHVVPTVGFVVQDRRAAVIIASDTGPTELLWQRAARLDRLQAVFLEATFPNALAWLAETAKHLTPRLFAAEARKIPAGVRLIAVHLHPRYQPAVVKELKALALPNLEMGRFGRAYVFE